MAWWNPNSWARLDPVVFENMATAVADELDRRSLENPSTNLANPASWLTELWGPPTASGVSVNEETALAHAAVFACNRVLAESMASLPLSLYRRLPNGDIELATKRPEYKLLAVAPSRLYTSFKFRETGQLHCGTNGNFYARIFRNGVGRPTELRILPPSQTTPFLYEDALYYRTVDSSNKTIVLSADEVLHVKGLSSDGLVGKSPITVARETIGNGLAEVKAMGAVSKNGGRIAGVLKHPGKLNPDQVKTLRDTWYSQYGGTENAGRVPILEAGMEFQQVALSPADAKFIESHNLNAIDVCSIYRVPPHMIGLLDRSTFNNIEHQSLEFVKYTMRPWAENWEAEYDRSILPTEAQGEYFYQHEFKELLRGDSKAQAEFLAKLWQIGAMSRDEVRRELNLNQIEGGDKFFIPVNMRDPLEPIPDPNQLQAQAAADQQNDEEDGQPNAR
jgi:HK97 family phage portal protein